MNVEYMRINDCVWVTEDDGLSHTRRYTDNIEKILIYENRYDILEKITKEEKIKLNDKKEFLKACKKNNKIFLISTIVSALIALLPFNGVILTLIKLSMIPMSAIFCSIFIHIVYHSKKLDKKIKGLENKVSLAEKERIRVRDELIKMKKESRDIEKDFERAKQLAQKIIDKNEGKVCEKIVLEEEPYFIELDGDVDYLERLNFDLENAYKDGVNSKNKIKVLKK